MKLFKKKKKDNDIKCWGVSDQFFLFPFVTM